MLENQEKYEDWDINNLTQSQAREIVYNGTYRFEVVEKEMYDQRRWVTCYETIIKDKKTDKYYRTYYDQGSTEYQDQRAFEYEEPEFVEVKKVVIQSYEWQVV